MASLAPPPTRVATGALRGAWELLRLDALGVVGVQLHDDVLMPSLVPNDSSSTVTWFE